MHGESPDVSEKWTGKEYFDGPGLYYFGARWYDPELGAWSSPDPVHQFSDPYAYGNDPINFVDKDGRSLLSALKTSLGIGHIINAISALNAASSTHSFTSGLESAFSDYAINEAGDYGSIVADGISQSSAAVSTVGATFQAAYGTFAHGKMSRWKTVVKPLGVTIRSSLENDYNTIYNAGVSFSRGDIGDGFSSLGAAGSNSVVTSGIASEYSLNKGFGSQQYRYYGSYEGGGYQGLVWGMPTSDHGSVSAETFGGNVMLYKDYYGQSDAIKLIIYRHEFYHIRQEVEYGVGGCLVRTGTAYNSDNAPAMYGYTQEQVRDAIEDYKGSGVDLNILEIEAQLKGGDPSNPSFGADYDTPIF